MSLTEKLDLFENKTSSLYPQIMIFRHIEGFQELIVEMREINKGLSKMLILEDKIGVCELNTTSLVEEKHRLNEVVSLRNQVDFYGGTKPQN